MSNNIKVRLINSTSVLLVVCIIICFVSPIVTSFAASANSVQTICTLMLRSSTSTSSTALATIPAKTDLTLLADSTNGWAKVSYAGNTGYCSTTYLQVPTGSTVKTTGITTDEVNLRSGKGTGYTSLALIPKSTVLTVSNNSDEDWAYVTYSGKNGYVNKSYFKIMFTLSVASTTATSPATVKATTPAQTISPTSSYKYTDPGYSSIPHWYDYSYSDSVLSGENNSIGKLMLSKDKIDININGSYKIIPFLAEEVPITNQVTYTSSNTDIATVSANGIITGKSQGNVNITVKDPVTTRTAVCAVTVSDRFEPTQAPTQSPTQAPTQAPTQKPTITPTSAPTQAPTQNPTVTPTSAPTQAPTQKPTVTPTSAPTQAPVAETLSLSKTSVTMYYNNHYQLFATSNVTVKWSTSDASVATVSNGIVISKGVGTATITASTTTKKATCTIKVISASTTIGVSHRAATIPKGKTFLATSTVSGATWSTSNSSVATVKNGYILGVSEGKAVITASTTGGNRTILVTVTAPEAIRFAYTSPNCAPKNSTVTLVAITDNLRTAVKFDVKIGTTTSTVNATSKTAQGSTYIWKGTIKFDSAGTYSVTAYSKYNNTWSTTSAGSATAFVTPTSDRTTTVCSARRPSDQMINFVATCEGYEPSVYDDPLTGDPTLGYGILVYPGDTFYNSLTKTEAYAYLVQSINNDGYSSKVNSFLINNCVKFNQQQYDALVSFVYNTGTGVLSNDDELVSALLTCSSGGSSSTTYYINGSYVRIRKGPSTSYDIIDELDYGTKITILQKTNSEWYYVQTSDGTKGYVCTDYISYKVTSGTLDLNYVNKQNLINKFCQYHHANGCVWGLLYRRVDEMEMFFYNDYSRNYGDFKYDIKFTCSVNPSFHT